jgi:DNA gyrase inhibitor GyrI
MDTVDVRIVTLPPMRVACTSGYGEQPELEAQGKLMGWVAEHHLMDGEQQPRFFGFNNPSPAPGSPNYGYEMWVTVGPEVQADREVSISEFEGGQFAVLRARGVENIYPAWQKLLAWVVNSPYRIAGPMCLEEHLVFWQIPLEELTLDLYLPVEMAK